MTDYKMRPYNLGNYSIYNAFNIVFADDILKNIYGSSLITTPWQDNKRISEFYVHLDIIPRVLKTIFRESRIYVTVNQQLSKTDSVWTIQNKIKANFIGSRFFNVESHFELQKHDNDVLLTGGVKCKAYLLHPLNIIAESFMISQCKNELTKYSDIVHTKFMNLLNT